MRVGPEYNLYTLLSGKDRISAPISIGVKDLKNAGSFVFKSFTPIEIGFQLQFQ